MNRPVGCCLVASGEVGVLRILGAVEMFLIDWHQHALVDHGAFFVVNLQNAVIFFDLKNLAELLVFDFECHRAVLVGRVFAKAVFDLV